MWLQALLIVSFLFPTHLPYPRTEPLPLDIRVVQEELSSGARLGTLFPVDNGLDLFADGGAKPGENEQLKSNES